MSARQWWIVVEIVGEGLRKYPRPMTRDKAVACAARVVRSARYLKVLIRPVPA